MRAFFSILCVQFALTAPSISFASASVTLNKAYTTPQGAAASVKALGKALYKKRDRRSLFPLIYALTIDSANRKLSNGEFENPRWVRSLIVNYANIYRRTIQAELQGKRSRLPRAWQIGFSYAEKAPYGSWSADRDLVYGINVHIAHDLVEALLITPTDFRSPSVRRDYFLITEALRGAMPAIWRIFVAHSNSLHLIPAIERELMVTWIGDLRYLAWMNAASWARYSKATQARLLRALDSKVARQSLNHGTLLPLLSRPVPQEIQ